MNTHDPFDDLDRSQPSPSAFDAESGLSEQQKEYIRQNYSKFKLGDLTKKVWNDDTIDGRSKKGMMVKAYLSELNKPIQTTERKQRKITLTTDQKQYILNHAHDMTPREIARIIFSNNALHQLSAEAAAVQEFIKEENPSAVFKNDMVNEDYQPPQTFNLTLEKVRNITGEKLDPKKIDIKIRKYIEQLMKYLRAPRFVSTMNTFSLVLERETFEQEFIKTTWNKPDLTADEINLYINVINEYIIQHRILNIVEKLNRQLETTADDENEGKKISMSLSDAIKGKNDEYDRSVKRQENLVSKLEGERSKRISQYREQNRSIAALVQIFKSEEERKNMLAIAEMRKKLLKKEIDKIEDADAFLARAFGISEDEILD